MSYRLQATALKDDARREWIAWLGRIQKSICSRYTGVPLGRFEHDRSGCKSGDGDGVLRAGYGAMQIVANLDNRPLVEGKRTLGPYGFAVTSPMLIAGSFADVGGETDAEGASYVAESNGRQVDLWLYAPPGRKCVVELPADLSGELTLSFDGQPPSQAVIDGRLIKFAAPVAPGAASASDKRPAVRRLWHATIRER
jgi:hypothetical protein